MICSRAKNYWTLWWMRYAGLGFSGRLATRLATWFVPPYCGRCSLARMNPKGYASPTAAIHHNKLILGSNVYIGDRVTIFNHGDGGAVELGDRVHLYGDTYVQTGQGGRVTIGRDSHIQPCCQLAGFKAAIEIGSDVQIAAGCAFYPYDHGIAQGQLICRQPLTTKGDIRIEDDAWLGYGVIVLSGVRIGKGAVIGAGSIVTHSIPDGGVAVGAPAKVLRLRD